MGKKFSDELGEKPLVVLRIPDDYLCSGPALITLLESELGAYIRL